MRFLRMSLLVWLAIPYGVHAVNDIDINIANGDDAEVADGVVNSSDGGTSDFSISPNAIETFVGDVSMSSLVDITITDTINKTNGGITLDPANKLFINAASVTTSGKQDYLGVTELGANVTLTNGTGDTNKVTFGDTVDGGSLSIAKDVQFDGAVGFTDALSSLYVGGNATFGNVTATTSGTQTYDGAAIFDSGGSTLTGTTLTFNGGMSGGPVNVNGAGVFNSAVSGLDSLTVTGTSEINSLLIDTFFQQSYQDAVTLSLSNVGFAASAFSKVFFLSTVTGLTTDLEILAHTTEFHGDVMVKSLDINGRTDIRGVGNIVTTNNQRYSNRVDVFVDTMMQSTDSDIFFGQRIDEASNLTIDAATDVFFSAAVGLVEPLSSLTVKSGIFDGDVIEIQGGLMKTVGDQEYVGDVVVDKPISLDRLTTFESANGTVIFRGRFDGDTTFSFMEQDILIDANAEFHGPVGAFCSSNPPICDPDVDTGIYPLDELRVTGTTLIADGLITTNRGQLYEKDVTLAAIANSSFLSSVQMDTIQFDGNVNGANQSLFIDGNATFNGLVGNVNALNILEVTKGAMLNGGAITTTGLQVFSGSVVLKKHTALNSGDTVIFEDTVNGDGLGPWDLTITGDAQVLGEIGGTDQLRDITFNDTAIIGDDVSVTNNQTYNDVAFFKNGVTLRARLGIIGGNVIFNNKMVIGNSPGQVSIDGNLSLDVTSILEIELGGLISGTEYDVLNVTDTANLAGDLDVLLFGGFEYSLGDMFDILTAEAIVGAFDTVSLPQLAGLRLEIQYLVDEIGATDVVRLTAVQTVPVPPAVWLFGSALGLLGWMQRKAT